MHYTPARTWYQARSKLSDNQVTLLVTATRLRTTTDLKPQICDPKSNLCDINVMPGLEQNVLAGRPSE